MNWVRLRAAIVVILVEAVTAAAEGAELAATLAARNSVTVGELHQHAAELANDTFEGREAGSRGGRAAAGYILNRIETYGLDPAGVDGAYTQTFLRSQRNLLCMLPGSDPQLADEVILIGAHYDHVGYGTPSNSFGPIGRIHNGADDNASGVSTVLEAAQALAPLRGSLKRSVLIAFWDGEEKGLLGSSHWLVHPTIKLTRVKCAINLDMVGRMRNNTLEVYGTRTAEGLRRRVSTVNAVESLTLTFPWTMIEDSDHYPFYRAGLPSMMLHTGKHGDYHRPSDDVEKLNAEGMQATARLLVDLVIDMAEGDALPKFREASRSECRDERVRDSFEKPFTHIPGRLGLTWKAERTGDAGIVVGEVSRGTAAARAGLVAGDRLTTWNGMPLRTNDEFQRFVSTSTDPVAMTVVSARGEERTVNVTLDGPPVRIGITWSVDDGDPTSVIVRRVNHASPADRGGIRPVDRICGVAGKSFASGDEFEQMLMSAAGETALTVERSGRLMDLTIDIGEPLPSAE